MSTFRGKNISCQPNRKRDSTHILVDAKWGTHNQRVRHQFCDRGVWTMCYDFPSNHSITRSIS